MLTNLIASVVVTLVTNVSHSDNGRLATSWYSSTTPPQSWIDGQPATEKYITTEVKRRTSVTFVFPDGEHTLVDEKLLSSVTEVLKRKDEWVKAFVRTNFPYNFPTNYSR